LDSVCRTNFFLRKYKNKTKILKNSMVELIYPELSYKIVGCLFEVYKNIGPNHRERYYQNALKEEFLKRKIKFQEQFPIKITYKDKKIGQNYFDFLIDDKIILEIKTGPYFKKDYLDQLLSYLKATYLKLGIIANFTRNGVKFHRVINIK